MSEQDELEAHYDELREQAHRDENEAEIDRALAAEFARLAWHVFDGSGPAIAAFAQEEHAVCFAKALGQRCTIVRFGGHATRHRPRVFDNGVEKHTEPVPNFIFAGEAGKKQ